MPLDQLSSANGLPDSVSAETPQESLDSDVRFKFVSFHVGDKQYAVSARAVAEVIGHLNPIPLPNSPAGLAGIAPHRGDILAVVDIGVCSNNADPAKRKAVVLRPLGDRAELALAFNVDRVGELLQVGSHELRSSDCGHPLAEFETITSGGPVLIIEPNRIAALVSA